MNNSQGSINIPSTNCPHPEEIGEDFKWRYKTNDTGLWKVADTLGIVTLPGRSIFSVGILPSSKDFKKRSILLQGLAMMLVCKRV